MRRTVTMAAATVGHAEGGTPLNAFDNALLAAGIGNINLLKVSSIIPPATAIVDLPKLKPGVLVPAAYTAMTSEVAGQTVAAAVGWALPDNPARPGVIMEFHDIATRRQAEHSVRAMLQEAFRVRGEPVGKLSVVGVEHTVERVGCVIAAVVLLAEDDLA